MNKLMRYLLLGTLLGMSANIAAAKETTTIKIEDVWIAEAPPVSKVHAGYLKLHNTSDTSIVLQGVSSDAYNSIEMHLSIERDGVASMRRMDEIVIDAGGTFEFKPGGYHLMLFTPSRRFKRGDHIGLNFRFDDGSTLTSTAMVKKHNDAIDHSHHHH